MNYHQQSQEDQYLFPYHYSDLFNDEDKLLWEIDRLNLLHQVISALAPLKDLKVLDAGCGDGRLCYELTKSGANVTGLDYSDAALNYARAFCPNVKFIKCDIENISLRDKFDRIVLMETIEHLDPKSLDKVIFKLKNLLYPKGKLIITVPSINLPINRYPKHYQHFTKDSLEEVLTPHYRSLHIFGYAKRSYKRKIFHGFRLLAYTFYPMRNKIGPVKRLYNFIQDYYKNELSTGDPVHCFGLIAICRNPINIKKK